MGRIKNNMAMCATALAIASPSSILAQSSPSAEQDISTDGELKVADIVVTARRREESLQSAPLSITALGSQELTERNIRDISDIALVTPGFSMQNIQAGTEQPFIRGMSSTSFDRTLQTSSTFVDGNYFSVLGRTVFFPDIERVEIVRGPQAALFGRATFAGAINYITKTPQNDFGGEVRITAGEHDRLNAHGSVTGPLIANKLLFRLSGNSEVYGGEYTNALDGQKTGVLRHYGLTAALRFLPTDDLTIDLKGVLSV